MRSARVHALIATAVVGSIVVAATFAFACTVQIEVRLDPPWGPAGNPTRISSRGYLPGEPVEIRWNSASGEVLGRATGDFSMPVAIPADAKLGVGYIVVVSPTAENRGGNRPVVPFEVTAPDASGPSSPGGTMSGNGSEGGQGSPSGQTFNSTAGGDPQSPGVGEPTGALGFAEPAPASASPVVQPVPGATDPVLAPDPESGFAPAPPVREPAPVGVADPALGVVPGSSAVPASATATPAVGAGEVATAQGATTSAGATGSAASPAETGFEVVAPSRESLEQRAPGPQTAYADLWSGFGSDNRRAPSLVDDLSRPSSGIPGPGLGVAVLGLGMAAMMAGFAVAEARRTRVTAVAAPAPGSDD